ncbi:Menaquinone reductase, molybdopterin-binding-like subunit [Desulfonema limicola]|uniref:Menaquinone reductase, molybdopterin-binding-like subunit n=1 Tax=Desulfonema limicola TaxID=45656 RepID=A0A975B4B5_9BACT|nr:menaquinone reductase molybdopterin-binding-like subunit QrcB [Desulfonema limicola]QTA78533.1 Menaquinone reductase, molybdopterin-binding-like subunit [Desulfonema limicola]
MKIDRRSFLSLGVGAGAGIALSPLPWKLTDDSSIWTQMWPWTPVPRDGAVNYVNTASTICSGGCGLSVRKIDDRAVKVEGLKGYPGSNGNACIHCMAGIQMLYSPNAVKSPMKRTGKRGEGKWQPISWDEAISETAKKLGELRESGKASTLACILNSDYGTIPALFKQFLNAFGSPNFMRTPSYQDAYEMTLALMHQTDSMAVFDAENADFVLSFGSGIIDGWGSSVRMFKANSSWKEKNVKLVQIEPRLSNTAAKSDQWLPVNPGTELILALGIAHVIITESLYNKDFVEKYAEGFEDWTDNEGNKQKGFKNFVLEGYSPSYAARVTGIEANTIVKLAKDFAGASAPLALCGRGQGTTPGSIHEFMAVHALNALVGNINKKGGIWAMPKPDYIKWEQAKLDDTAREGLKVPRADGAGTEKFPHAKYLLTRLPEVINSAKESPIQALFVSGANPAYTLPDTKAVAKAFASIPFIVSFTSHMDETAEMADIILPNHGHFERYEDIPAPPGYNKPVVGLARPVISPQHNTRHVGDTLIAIAGKLGGTIAESFPWKSYEECLEKTMGENWTSIQESGVITNPDYEAPGWDTAFETSSKKFAFIPGNHNPGNNSLQIPVIEGNDNYRLTLIPYDSMRLAAGPVGNTPFVTKTVSEKVLKGNDICIEINPKTAEKYGLKQGQYAILTTPKGKAKVKTELSPGIMPDIIAMPRGLGHTGIDEYLAGKGININELIGPVEDPASGLDAAWGIKADLVKA